MNYNCRPVSPAETPYTQHERPTQNGLSYSPADMNSLTAAGRTTSLNALQSSAYFSGGDVSHDIPLECQRGVDMNDAFELEQRTRKGFQEFKNSNHSFKGREQSVDSKGGD